LGKIYGSVWVLLLLVAVGGLLLKNHSEKKRLIDTFQFAGLGAIAAIGVTVLQIAMLEASNGFYMTVGANLYLLPMFPLVLAFICAGIARLHSVLTSRNSIE
jgi:hypothetical protein